MFFSNRKSSLPSEILSKLPQNQLGVKFNWLNNQPYSTRYYDILKKRILLPVWNQKHEFLSILDKSQTM